MHGGGALSKALWIVRARWARHSGGMNNPETKAADETVAKQAARTAAIWVLRQAEFDVPLEHAQRVLAAWCPMPPMALAMLPDGPRMLAAATQDLINALNASPHGRHALREIGLTQGARADASTWPASGQP